MLLCNQGENAAVNNTDLAELVRQLSSQLTSDKREKIKWTLLSILVFVDRLTLWLHSDSSAADFASLRYTSLRFCLASLQIM